jgi:hypothetical protein
VRARCDFGSQVDCSNPVIACSERTCGTVCSAGPRKVRCADTLPRLCSLARLVSWPVILIDLTERESYEQNKPCRGDEGALVCTGGTERDDSPCITLSDCGNSGKGNASDFGSGNFGSRLRFSRLLQALVPQNVPSGTTVLFHASASSRFVIRMMPTLRFAAAAALSTGY